MNKEKEIKELARIITERCEAELGQVHASSMGGKVTKTVGISLIAKDIYDAGYRKVPMNGLVVLGTSESFENFENELRKGTAKDILQKLFDYYAGDNDEGFSDFEVQDKLKELAEKYGVEVDE